MMTSNEMTAVSRIRQALNRLGMAMCLAPLLATGNVIADEAGLSIESRFAAEEMRLIGRQIATSAWQSSDGKESTFKDLARRVAHFEEQKKLVQPDLLARELSAVDVAWQPIKRAAQTLIEAGPEVIFVNEVVKKYGKEMGSMQREFAQVADIVRDQKYGSVTNSLAQKNLWLNERINRNINRVLVGNGAGDKVPEELRADSAELLANIERLTRGDAPLEVRKIADPKGMADLTSAFGKFSAVSQSVDRIIGSAGVLHEAAAARELILSSNDALDAALASLLDAVDKNTVGGSAASASAGMLLAAPILLALALGLVSFLYLGQRRNAARVKEGMAAITSALGRIGKGDLTVRVAEDNSATAEIARQLNAATNQQCELIGSIRGPFDVSVQEVNAIGVSARSLVEKGKELTLSVGESIAAATEMVRTSEDIKASTAEAARTSDRNCQQVAQGYELTKDMSKASVDVRESVQETSKSAKRQGELIQSVTAAAEYIQALNTKISVVAINTRIEAEKAGEYGRPFLGIAEAIADLLREAGEEGRKIISEVRTLQNMSAENLASMENTVGTVVTILQYIERLDSSLEEINSGSAAISTIIRSVDDAAGQSAVSALHMNSSMTQIGDRNLEIGKFSESTKAGVSRLQKTLRDAAESLGQFKPDGGAGKAERESTDVEDLERIGAAPRVYREEDMSAFEVAQRARASV